MSHWTRNAGAVSSEANISVILMACWAAGVGARDLGLAAPKSILSPPALLGLALSAAVVALHEGCLAPLGADLVGGWRRAGHPLPAAAVVRGRATALLALRVPHDVSRLRASLTLRVTPHDRRSVIPRAISSRLDPRTEPRAQGRGSGDPG